MSSVLEPPYRTEWLGLYGRLRFLKRIAEKRQVIAFHKQWHGVAAPHDDWFRLQLRAHRPGRAGDPTEVDRYVAALEDLARELALRGSWCEKALHQMIAGPRFVDTLVPIVVGAATETYYPNIPISRSLTLTQAQTLDAARLAAEWGAGDLAERPPKPRKTERNIRWLLWRLDGHRSRQIAAHEAQLRDLDIAEETVRQGVKQAAVLIGLRLPGSRDP